MTFSNSSSSSSSSSSNKHAVLTPESASSSLLDIVGAIMDLFGSTVSVLDILTLMVAGKDGRIFWNNPFAEELLGMTTSILERSSSIFFKEHSSNSFSSREPTGTYFPISAKISSTIPLGTIIFFEIFDDSFPLLFPLLLLSAISFLFLFSNCLSFCDSIVTFLPNIKDNLFSSVLFRIKLTRICSSLPSDQS